jgi:hypothetical protein
MGVSSTVRFPFLTPDVSMLESLPTNVLTSNRLDEVVGNAKLSKIAEPIFIRFPRLGS